MKCKTWGWFLLSCFVTGCGVVTDHSPPAALLQAPLVVNVGLLSVRTPALASCFVLQISLGCYGEGISLGQHSSSPEFTGLDCFAF